MLEIQGHALVSALNSLARVDDIAKTDASIVYKSGQSADAVRFYLNELIEQLERLELRVAIKKAKNILQWLELAGKADPKTLAGTVSSEMKELRERIEHEIEDRKIYYLSHSKAKMFEKDIDLYDRAVIDKFPDAVTDLSEAARCLGLSRNTATVFHLMRAMEHAISKIGAKLGAVIIDKNNNNLEWGKIISNAKDEVESMKKGNEREKWSQIITLLYHVKECWRNSTMHPKQTYTGEEAEEVFNAVKSFMNHLAQEL